MDEIDKESIAMESTDRGGVPPKPQPTGSEDAGGPKGRSSSPPKERTADEVMDWIVTYLAGEMQVEPSAIDVSAPFDNLAVDSVTAVGMTGALEEWLGVSIDPMVVYDYPTIEAMSQYLAEQTGGS